jgi:hypothetical protein
LYLALLRLVNSDPEVPMRVAALLSSAVLLIACAKTEEKPADTATAAAAPAPAPAPAPALSLASLAGKWTQVAKAEGTDSVLVTGELNATADASGWTMSLPGRPNIPLTVKADGDSVIVDAGPFESVLRKGVQVTNHGVYRMQGDKLVGKTIAHYSVKTADSVRRIDSEFTRKP